MKAIQSCIYWCILIYIYSNLKKFNLEQTRVHFNLERREHITFITKAFWVKENYIEVLVSINQMRSFFFFEGSRWGAGPPLPELHFTSAQPTNPPQWPMRIILGAYHVTGGISPSGQRRGNRRRGGQRERKPTAPISRPAGGHHHHRHDQHPRAGNLP
jgi:hypothetical protein